MAFQELRPAARRLTVLVWVAGLVALAGTTIGYLLNAAPYPAPWAWLSFLAMMAMDDLLFGSDERASWSEVPKITFLAGVIVFRRHPEIIALTAMSAGPLASLIKRQPWFTHLTAAAHWTLAAAVGSAVFRLVGFTDTGHFVLATVALGLITLLLGPALSSCMEAAQTGAPYGSTYWGNQGSYWLGGMMGAGLALLWRTPSLGPEALKVGELALTVLAGVCIGSLLGGGFAGFLQNIRPLGNRRTLGVAVLLLGMTWLLHNTLVWVCLMVVAAAVIVWAVQRRVYGLACAALGGLSNALVVTANAGRMPVVAAGAQDPGGLSDTSHFIAGPHTGFIWLADRFALPVFPGIASAGDILLALGFVWAVAALMVRRPVPLAEPEAAVEAAA